MGFMQTAFGGSTSEGSRVDPTQQPYLQDLYGRAQLASYGNQGQDYSQQFQQPSYDAVTQHAQGGFQNPQLNQGLQDFGQQQNQALGGAIDAGLGQIGRDFNRNIMPGINTGSAMSNTSGGSRQGIAQGLAASDANQQATDFVNQMQSQNWQQQQQNQLGAYGMQAGLQGQQNAAQQGAMGQAQGLSNLGFNSQYGNLNALGGILGSPTVLGGSSSSQGPMFAPIKL